VAQAAQVRTCQHLLAAVRYSKPVAVAVLVVAQEARAAPQLVALVEQVPDQQQQQIQLAEAAVRLATTLAAAVVQELSI